jgi:EmrB/QacA subfamily drug resistance transporter
MKHRSLVLLAVLLATFTVNLTLTILTIAIAPIAEDLHAPVSAVAWVTFAPMVVTALLAPAAGRASDRFGRKRGFLVGFAVAAIGMALSGFAPTLATLIAARVLTGAGTAAVMPAGLALVAGAYPAEEHSIPLGWWTSMSALAPTLGIIVGGFLVESLSWRWLFFGQLPFALAAFTLAALVLDEERSDSEARFDVEGAVLIGISIFCMLVAVNQSAHWGLGSARTIGLFAASLVAAMLCIRVERRAAEPVLPVSLFERPDTGAALLSRAVLNGLYMGAFIILPLWMLKIRHMGPALVSLALVPRPLSMSLAGPLAARLGLSWPSRTLIRLGATGIAVASGYMALMSADSSYVWFVMALVVMGTGLAFTQTASAQVVTSSVPRQDLGAASGVLAITSSLAHSLGMAGLLAVVEVFGGTEQPSAYRMAFALASVLSFATLPVTRHFPGRSPATG